jgi:hypothetical protein
MPAPQESAMKYAFTLEVAGTGTGQDNYEHALRQAGCNDALIAAVNNTMFPDLSRH